MRPEWPNLSCTKCKQAYFVCFLTLPWLVFAIVAFDLLPNNWRFEQWPEPLRKLSIFGFAVFAIADALFAICYWAAMVKEAYGDKREPSTEPPVEATQPHPEVPHDQ